MAVFGACISGSVIGNRRRPATPHMRSYIPLFERLVFKDEASTFHNIKWPSAEAWAFVLATASISALTIVAVYKTVYRP